MKFQVTILPPGDKPIYLPEIQGITAFEDGYGVMFIAEEETVAVSSNIPWIVRGMPGRKEAEKISKEAAKATSGHQKFGGVN